MGLIFPEAARIFHMQISLYLESIYAREKGSAHQDFNFLPFFFWENKQTNQKQQNEGFIKLGNKGAKESRVFWGGSFTSLLLAVCIFFFNF